jgi:hypothetical protein
MFKPSRKKRNFSPARVADGVPRALAHGAEEATNRLSGAVENAGALVAKTAGSAGDRVAKTAGSAGDRVAKTAGSAGDRVAKTAGSAGDRASKLRPSSDAVLKAQLIKTSRELARESSDLGQAVGSLNAIIRANRRAAVKGRTRLIAGIALGAGLMYHLDAEHGRARRAATVRRLGALRNR